ncbi:hypothetical protein [Desulfosporosinus sp. OT]|uniref:hypothetical protein n=1 Tax=Desulfosporosinus sp. OT TaxID=913865 RepID=UPI000223A8D9|nr:hypothetical protein [Desulfosporosinus sp. OT]EGW39793.1 putative membrane protein [Desulfosporosinus sp. OT]
MEWYSLREIAIVGKLFSIVIMALGYILFWWELKNPKNLHKLVGELSLERYLRVGKIGLILTIVFEIIILIVR